MPVKVHSMSSPNVRPFSEQVRDYCLMLPMRALLDLLHEFGPDEFRPPAHRSGRFGSYIKPFHKVVCALRHRVLKFAVEPRRTDQFLKFLLADCSLMQHGYG